MDVWTTGEQMDIRIRNQRELDKIFETVDSIYGFFVSALTIPRYGNNVISAYPRRSGRIQFTILQGYFDLLIQSTYITVIVDRYDIRETKYFKTRIERYI